MLKHLRTINYGLIAVLFAATVSLLVLYSTSPPPAPEYRLTSIHHLPPHYMEGENIERETERLIAEGADIDALDAQGHTPLWGAVRYKNLEHVHVLLKQGADPDVTGPEADGPLWTATFCGSQSIDQQIVKALIDAGADVNVAGRSYGRTPLHNAVSSENLSAVKMLVAAGADVNAGDTIHDSTPLQSAVCQGNSGIADFLLSMGADPELRNTRGFRPIDQLNACPNPEEIQAVFRAHGTDDQRRPELLKQFAVQDE